MLVWKISDIVLMIRLEGLVGHHLLEAIVSQALHLLEYLGLGPRYVLFLVDTGRSRRFFLYLLFICILRKNVVVLVRLIFLLVFLDTMVIRIFGGFLFNLFYVDLLLPGQGLTWLSVQEFRGSYSQREFFANIRIL